VLITGGLKGTTVVGGAPIVVDRVGAAVVGNLSVVAVKGGGGVRTTPLSEAVNEQWVTVVRMVWTMRMVVTSSGSAVEGVIIGPDVLRSSEVSKVGPNAVEVDP